MCDLCYLHIVQRATDVSGTGELVHIFPAFTLAVTARVGYPT